MPKYRQLHVKIIDSFDFNEMPDDFTRVTWMLLTLVVDSEGRGIDNMAWVKSKMYPMRPDVEHAQLEAAFDWFADRKMIIRYEVNGHCYFYIPTFQQYQTGTKKEAESLLPSPPELRSNSGPTPEEVGAAASASASESVFKSANIFKTYEREIGPITKAISDDILDVMDDYPAEYFEFAFTEAAQNNKRSWAYAKAILKRLKTEGMNPANGNGHKREEYKGAILVPGVGEVKV